MQWNPTSQPKTNKQTKKKGKEAHTQFDKTFTKDTHSKPKEQLFKILFPKLVVISATLIENSSNVYFYLFSIFNYKIEQDRKHNWQL